MHKSMPVCVFSLICLLAGGLHAQNNKAPDGDSLKVARVEVSVVDAKSKPRKGELVLFISQTTKKVFSAYSDSAGKLNVWVPAGDEYLVTVKAFSDTSKYGTLKVPALAPGQYFKDALGVDIMYEPGREFILDDVKYDFAKATLRPESFAQLQELYEYLKWKTDIKIEVAGHTDNVGKPEDNLKLSQARAESVRTWLLNKGIEPTRVTARGYGATQPIADNTTDAGRQKNRRTEVHIL
jgi:outer membrane protein OmpA-like peptidoglycan-associated protein